MCEPPLQRSGSHGSIAFSRLTCIHTGYSPLSLHATVLLSKPVSTSASIHRAGLASLRVRRERSRAHTIMAKPRRSVRTLQHARCRVRRPSSVQACAHMSARTDVHLILVGALRACADAHVVPAVASEQGRATATEIADIADSAHGNTQEGDAGKTRRPVPGSTRPEPLPETQHPPCMRSRRKTRR